MIGPHFKQLNGKNVLVIVAHPDDESLYFFAGIKELSSRSRLKILCVTYTPMSERGKELIAVCTSMNIECDFLAVADLGIRSVLVDLEARLKKYLTENIFDLIITHAPHGGEKPHPHHLQTFLSTFAFCLKMQSSFGFFSDRELPLCEQIDFSHYFRLKIFQIFFLYLSITRCIEWRYRLQWLCILLANSSQIVSRLAIEQIGFSRCELLCDIREKQLTLEKYSSQVSVLRSYKSSTCNRDYLFLLNLD